MLKSQPLVCTILPTYNESENIVPLILGVLENATTPHRVLVVDDNSPDGTSEIVENLALTYASTSNESGSKLPDPIVLIRRLDEKGLTSAIQRGIDEAIYNYGAEIVTWMDCDLSMPPQDISKLVRAIVEENADVAIGSRWIPGGADVAHSKMALTLSYIINRFAMLMLGHQVHDYTSGFVAARADLFRKIRLNGDYGEYCIDLLGRAVKMGFRVREEPYVCVPRTAGDSKTGANLWDYLSKGRKYVATIWKLRDA